MLIDGYFYFYFYVLSLFFPFVLLYTIPLFFTVYFVNKSDALKEQNLAKLKPIYVCNLDLSNDIPLVINLSWEREEENAYAHINISYTCIHISGCNEIQNTCTHLRKLKRWCCMCILKEFIYKKLLIYLFCIYLYKELFQSTSSLRNCVLYKYLHFDNCKCHVINSIFQVIINFHIILWIYF